MQYEQNRDICILQTDAPRVKINGEIRQLFPDYEQSGKFSHIPENELTEEQSWMNKGYRIGQVVND